MLDRRDLRAAALERAAETRVADRARIGADVDRLRQIDAAEHDAGVGWAGRSVIVTFCPVCSPTPVALITDLIVRCEHALFLLRCTRRFPLTALSLSFPAKGLDSSTRTGARATGARHRPGAARPPRPARAA